MRRQGKSNEAAIIPPYAMIHEARKAGVKVLHRPSASRHKIIVNHKNHSYAYGISYIYYMVGIENPYKNRYR